MAFSILNFLVEHSDGVISPAGPAVVPGAAQAAGKCAAALSLHTYSVPMSLHFVPSGKVSLVHGLIHQSALPKSDLALIGSNPAQRRHGSTPTQFPEA